jgi:hypothetical protein
MLAFAMTSNAPKRSDSISSSRVGEGSPLNPDHRPGLVEVRSPIQARINSILDHRAIVPCLRVTKG